MKPIALLFATTALLPLTVPAFSQEEVGKRKGEAIKIRWTTYDEAKNYSIEHESAIPRSTVKTIATELEDALGQYVLLFKFKPDRKLKVKFLDSPNTYEQEGGKPSTAGHFDPGTGYLVLKQLSFEDLIPTTYHEAFHQYLHYYVGQGVEIPTWFNEGMAGYFQEMKRQKGTKKLDYKLIDNRKLRMTRDKVMTRTALPLHDLVNASYTDFHDRVESLKEAPFYNQSFSVIYFFMNGMGGRPAFQFADELKKKKDVAAAMEKVFGKDLKNFKSFEEKWKGFMAQLKIDEKV